MRRGDHPTLLRKKKRFYHQAGAITAIFGFVFGLVFISGSITGSAVSEISGSGATITGAIFILIGLIGSFISLRNRL